jgi:hypothetical protein
MAIAESARSAEGCELCGRELAGLRDDEPRLCAECLDLVMMATLLDAM